MVPVESLLMLSIIGLEVSIDKFGELMWLIWRRF